MKKVLFVSALVFAITFAMQCSVFASTGKYAVVDVKKVVNSSKSVKALKIEREKQKQTVANFIKDSNVKVAAEKDPKKKEELKKKLTNDLKYMSKTYDQRYADGLKKINTEISSDIAKVGKEKQYDLILTSDAVLFGGDNITSEIIKAVK